MSKPKRLHPIAAITSFFKQLKEMIFPIIASTVFGGGMKEWSTLFIPLGFVIFALISGLLTWFRYTYRIEENELRIESGVFVKKKRYIPFERIQSLNQSEGILHRPFGLVKLSIDTAAKADALEAEGELVAITKEEAVRIQTIIAEAKNGGISAGSENVNTSQPEIVIYKIAPKELFLLAATSGGVGMIISAIIAFAAQFSQMIPYKKLFHRFEDIITNGMVFVSILVFIVFIFVWVVALISMMLKYADFKVVKSGEDLIISRGVIEKRQVTIPFKRIQAIRISQNILRQPLGYATVYLENAGGGLNEQDGITKFMLLPLVKRKDIEGILQRQFPEYQLDVALKGAPKRALLRYILKGVLIPVPVIAIAVGFFPVWGWLSVLILLPISVLQYLRHRDAGWNITDDQLTLQYRLIDKNMIFLKKKKVQALEQQESFLQTRKNLASIKATVAAGFGGSHGKVVDIEQEHADQIYRWYSYEQKAARA
ncbi:PH domain-containing protein [Bacillus marasmi]|uniref:PH domain-containing protein n=1 Tax=Bacillus marasmi TaxID=1926279 RepID=UPI00164D7512|nr:PH domain-containing protein [Bacillus marasmi]